MIRDDVRNGTKWLTLARPERLNALRSAEYRSLRTGIEEACWEPDVRVIALTGEGRAFSAGADRSLIDGSASEAERQSAGTEFDGMLQALVRCEKPVVGVVNGLAVGIGSTILLHCDLVLMAESARLRFPFTALGLVPEAGSSALLPARVSWSDAAWAMLSSEWIDSSDALSMGLVWRVSPDARLMEDAEGVTGTLSRLDPEAVAATKRLLMAGRAGVVRSAMEREKSEMARLLGRRTAGTGEAQPPAGSPGHERAGEEAR